MSRFADLVESGLHPQPSTITNHDPSMNFELLFGNGKYIFEDKHFRFAGKEKGLRVAYLTIPKEI